MLDGDWDDVIGLSTRDVSFGKEGGTVEVTFQGHCWLNEVKINNERYSMDLGVTSYTQDWLSVNMVEKSIFIEVSPNETGVERTFSIGLQAGNYFAMIEGVQTAD